MSIRKRERAGKPWEVRLATPNGGQISRSFRLKGDAERWEREQQTQLDHGDWVNPNAARITLVEYAETFMATRQIRPRTRELYASLLRRHVLPAFGDVTLSRITTVAIRDWNAEIKTSKPSTAAKAYRLLSTMMNQAVDDQLIYKSPCRVKGASVEYAPERETATVAELALLDAAADRRIRALILLGAWCSLRLSEMLGLQRKHIDPLHGTVRIEQQRHEAKGQHFELGPPKTAAGRRTVTIPGPIMPAIVEHLELFAQPGPDGFVFTGPQGGPLRKATLYKLWAQALAASGIDKPLHIHDLRHTGNTLAAATGASTRELMSRAGHSTPRASILYQHATAERDEAIAAALGDLMTGVRPAPRAAVRSLLWATDGPEPPPATSAE